MIYNSYTEYMHDITMRGPYVKEGSTPLREAKCHWLSANCRLIDILDLIKCSDLPSDKLLQIVEGRIESARQIMRHGVEYLWEMKDE